MNDVIVILVLAAGALIISAAFCVSVAWIHYPQGIIKGIKENRRNKMKRELCVPCAAKLADTNDVKKTGYRRDKITCSECQRRRYGAEYEVSQKAEKGEKHDTVPE